MFVEENPLQYFNYTYSLDLCRFDCVLAVGVAECGCLRSVDKRFLRDDVNVSFCSNKEMKVGDGIFMDVAHLSTFVCAKVVKSKCKN